MQFEFRAKIWCWKGPAPWYFVTVPAKRSRELKAIESIVTYGWGMIPVTVRIGKTEWKTSLWPKDGRLLCLSRRASEKQRILMKATKRASNSAYIEHGRNVLAAAIEKWLLVLGADQRHQEESRVLSFVMQVS